MPDSEAALFDCIKTLNERVWEARVQRPAVELWLRNFAEDPGAQQSGRLHALYLLSRFIYFGDKEIRQMLRALYRDVFRQPIVAALRVQSGHTTHSGYLRAAFEEEQNRTRFLGIGNPSESGSHLLYYFRQENRLSKDLFISPYQVFARGGRGRTRLRFPEATRYVFIDDFCGSGQQAREYSQEIVVDLKRLARRDGAPVHVAYYVLVATETGRDAVRNNTLFDEVSSVVVLDKSFQCFSPQSRLFSNNPIVGIDAAFARHMCERYGRRLVPLHPLGYGDGQLLVGFHHNTPDNSLPIMWFDEPGTTWQPAFRRYPKLATMYVNP